MYRRLHLYLITAILTAAGSLCYAQSPASTNDLRGTGADSTAMPVTVPDDITQSDGISSEDEAAQEQVCTESDESQEFDSAVPEEDYQIPPDTAEEQQTATTPVYTAPGGPGYNTLDIEGADRPEVDRYRQHYIAGYGRKELIHILENAEPYRPYIRAQLKKRGMPLCLEYLPVVESSYNPKAKSRSGAVGLWQFMENSIRPYLKKTDWLDERLDPWKSTDAALTKLEENYKMFGDWPLAIAAYNCGAGAMKRILAKAPEKTFWYIAEKGLLRDQSTQYVPRFLAIADIIQNEAYYGLPPTEVPVENRYTDFDYVTVHDCTSLTRLAGELRLSTKEIFLLNPSLLAKVTPPHSDYEIRLPSGLHDAAVSALDTIGTAKVQMVVHKVQQGDTLWGIARANGLTVAELCSANNIKEKSILSIGQTIYVPILE